jgi:hypothetical protein
MYNLRFHLVKAAVLLNDYFKEMAEIDKFVFSMNERRLQHVLSATVCNMYKKGLSHLSDLARRSYMPGLHSSNDGVCNI